MQHDFCAMRLKNYIQDAGWTRQSLEKKNKKKKGRKEREQNVQQHALL